MAAANNDTAIRPFRVDIPEKELVQLRRRIVATRWPTGGCGGDGPGGRGARNTGDSVEA